MLEFDDAGRILPNTRSVSGICFEEPKMLCLCKGLFIDDSKFLNVPTIVQESHFLFLGHT
jgi:hypothetical protein